ncbi:MAG: DUF3833 domain-containing protein [Cocleimonas sp.]
MSIQDYKQNQPSLTLFDYFEGETRGWGIFQDRSGNLKRQFVVNIIGTINEKGQLVLVEDFVWTDGEISQRIWTISKEGENKFSGTASDVVGKAEGESAGNAFHWQYVMNLAVKDKTYKVSFDDWMFLQEDGVLLNRAKMSKFGITLGEVIISFKK